MARAVLGTQAGRGLSFWDAVPRALRCAAQVLAYRYTSLTSVTLLDCFTIPLAVALSAAVLGARYCPGHYAGAAVCLAGLVILVLSDRGGGDGGGSSGGREGAGRAWFGDALVLLGASLYAGCNVLAEKLLGEPVLHPRTILCCTLCGTDCGPCWGLGSPGEPPSPLCLTGSAFSTVLHRVGLLHCV